VVGYASCTPPSNEGCRALIWEENSAGNWVATDLNTLLSPSDPLYGSVTMVEATSINDVGQILVIANRQGPTTLVLNPVVTNAAVAAR
jgi:hypothetical protein